jgi:hypothetical protein
MCPVSGNGVIEPGAASFTRPPLRFPGDGKTIPLRSSPKLTALMNNMSRFCAAIRVLTFGSGWGWGRINSDGTLVSNRNPLIRNRRGGKGGVAPKECIRFFVREHAASAILRRAANLVASGRCL